MRTNEVMCYKTGQSFEREQFFNYKIKMDDLKCPSKRLQSIWTNLTGLHKASVLETQHICKGINVFKTLNSYNQIPVSSNSYLAL